jgi:ribonuclease HI
MGARVEEGDMAEGEVTWHIYTDGSCMHGIHNVPKATPGWGGWAAIVEHGSDGQVVRGRVPATTNVRMELRAAIEGIRVVPDGAHVVLHTDCTTISAVFFAWKEERVGVFTGSDAKLWLELDAEFERLHPRVHLIVRGEVDPIHKRAHVIAGAEARGGLRNLPLNATPLEDPRRIKREVRRHARRHLVGCEPGFCMIGCPTASYFSAVGDLSLRPGR